MFDILMYLFENYIHSDAEVMVDHEELTSELTRAGFRRDEISKALCWLEGLAELQNSDNHPYLIRSDALTTRVYTAEEAQHLDAECRGFLMFLENIQVLDMETREMVIDRVMDLDMESIELEDLKWVILMVLFNVPGREGAYSQMEDLVFDVNEGFLH
jgi:Smg protein